MHLLARPAYARPGAACARPAPCVNDLRPDVPLRPLGSLLGPRLRRGRPTPALLLLAATTLTAVVALTAPRRAVAQGSRSNRFSVPLWT